MMMESFATFAAGSPSWVRLLAIVAGSYVSEDLALGASAWLFAHGEMSFGLLFAGNVLGIASGDLAIFGLGRWLGPRAQDIPVVGGAFVPERRARGQAFWARWGAGVLVISRFLPGSRVITAFTAGLFRFPAASAAALFFALAAAWVTAGAFGLRGLAAVLSPIQILLLAAVGICAARFVGDWLDSGLSLRNWLRVRWYRLMSLRHFEFWPMWLFYPPVAVHYLALAAKHRSLLLPSLANPSITSGGIIGESKDEILRRLPQKSPFRLRSLRLEPGCDAAAEAVSFLRSEGLDYPVILKPDVGQRGSGVRLVRTRAELNKYLSAARFPTLLQEHCAFPHEAGIFYLRAPREACGRLTSVTRKLFPTVVGDGRSTLAELILADARARLIAEVYLARFQERRDEILRSGEILRLVESGNHCQGCVFLNGAELITPELSQAIDELLRSTMPDFYVGRLDVRFESDEILRRGTGFKVVEINGAASEATHIYDPNETLSGAYRSLRGQMDALFEIGAYNRRTLGIEPMGLGRLVAELAAYKRTQTGHPATS